MPEPVAMEHADFSDDFINLFQLIRTVFRPNRRDSRLKRRLARDHALWVRCQLAFNARINMMLIRSLALNDLAIRAITSAANEIQMIIIAPAAANLSAHFVPWLFPLFAGIPLKPLAVSFLV